MMPHEFGAAPAPSRYFMETAFYHHLADRTERTADLQDSDPADLYR